MSKPGQVHHARSPAESASGAAVARGPGPDSLAGDTVTGATEVRQGPAEITMARTDETLRGGDVLPGFSLDVCRLFER